MTNSARGSSTRKMTDYEAYEQLPITLKRCLQESVTEWCSYWILKSFQKSGLDRTIKAIHDADDYFMRKKLQSTRFKKADIVSSYVACKIGPLRTYGIKPGDRVGTHKTGE